MGKARFCHVFQDIVLVEVLDHQPIVPKCANSDKSGLTISGDQLLVVVPCLNFLSTIKGDPRVVEFNWMTHLSQSLQKILLDGPFALSHHLLHDHSYDLPTISTLRVPVLLIVCNQDCPVVSQPNGLSRSHVVRTEDLLRIEGR
jgi:hypothetical protein